ncbi:adenosylcobinamide-GDP ribazoletransferase [Thalassococcus sp. S3]|uniref:adenosylcobinamide-GDP ribazoletransferase n=1 Tax=Thalassococcus sp. S3 TaxID=2017482 RepID=UPI0010246F3D|nr:adenosylcobinamide-GDP ribazoletransferase [Thalassococcus sp. S3]QBF32428.1 adenosylcobinamide-GDP ribazoletransferase [Thalassococcus sp. S3]
MPETDKGLLRLWDVPVAFALLSRLPVPHPPDAAFARQARGAWAFPLVGIVIGGLSLTVASLAMMLGLPALIAAGLALGTQMALTGAMHEDGLADTVDGLWGGWTVERRLEIMKDSHIGTYGVLALILSFGLRWVTLATVLITLPAGLVVASTLSRAGLPALMTALPQARASGLSHRVGVPGWPASAIALGLALFFGFFTAGLLILPALILTGAAMAGVGLVAKVRIGGQTGDILGAAQQVGEIACLLTLLVLA